MSLTDDLERLAALHRSGALADVEFASAKARAIGGDGDGLRRAEPIARGLHSLQRSRSDRWLGGVCGGLAAISGLPSWLWRLIFIALVACAGCGLWAYLLLWILLPMEDGVIDAGNGAFRAS